ncbi:MAG: hypothetical protein J6W65_00280, partial [Oscillospiraceae bacterium]|nr:hypothetical protein [Oscillospiraceae bacterium]
MSKIFRSEEVVKIAEAVMIPDCVVRVDPHELPESTLIGMNEDAGEYEGGYTEDDTVIDEE